MNAIGLNPIKLDAIGLDPIRMNAIRLGVLGASSDSGRPYIAPNYSATLKWLYPPGARQTTTLTGLS